MAVRIPIAQFGNQQPQAVQGGQAMRQLPNALPEVVQAVSPFVSTVMHEVQQARQEVDQIQFHQAMNEVMAGDEAELSQARQLQGQDFINRMKQIQDGRAQRVEKVMGALPERLRERAQVAAGHASVAFAKGLDHHLAQQTEWLKQTNAKTSEQALYTYAVAHPDDEAGISARLGLALSAHSTANAGLSPEAMEQQRRSLAANALIQQGTAIMKADPVAAQAFYEKNAEAMSASVHFGDFKARFDANMTANKVQTFADSVQGVPLEEALVKARKEFAGNPEALRDATQEIEHRFSVHQRARAVAQEEAAGKVLDMYQPSLPGQKAVSPSAIKRTPEWASLDSDQRHKIMDYWDRKAKEGGDGGSGLERFATFLRLTDDPKRLASMSDAQIVGLAPVLGDNLAGKLLSAKREAAGDLAKLEKVSLTDLDLRGIAAEYGVKTKGKMTLQDEATLGRLRDLTMDAIRAEQGGSGTPMTQPRKEEILRGLLQSVTLKRRALWDKEKPLFKVTVKDVAGDFTADEKKAAIGALVAAGVPTTPQNMAVMVERIRSRKEGK